MYTTYTPHTHIKERRRRKRTTTRRRISGWEMAFYCCVVLSSQFNENSLAILRFSVSENFSYFKQYIYKHCVCGRTAVSRINHEICTLFNGFFLFQCKNYKKLLFQFLSVAFRFFNKQNANCFQINFHVDSIIYNFIVMRLLEKWQFFFRAE